MSQASQAGLFDPDRLDEPDGLYFVYGVCVQPDGSKDRTMMCTLDRLDHAQARADQGLRAYDYCYVKQFGQGTVYVAQRPVVGLLSRRDVPLD